MTEATRYREFVRGGNLDVIATAFYIEDEWLIAPINATLRLGQQYGPASFLRQETPVPRGSLGTTPDIYRLDLGLRYTRAAFGSGTLTVRLDVFNVFDFDAETEVDERADRSPDGRASATFGFPIRFQQPRSVRIGLQYGFSGGHPDPGTYPHRAGRARAMRAARRSRYVERVRCTSARAISSSTASRRVPRSSARKRRTR